MSTTLVTGATGLIGYNIVKQLLEEGRNVRALVRGLERGKKILPDDCELALGDVTAPDSLAAAMQGCDVVYHAAGVPEQWFRDPKTFQRVNVEGTANVLKAAADAGIKKFIYTSTIDVFQGHAGEKYDESIIDPEPKGTYYERSKQEADRLAVEALENGLHVVFLHPSGLYGPGPEGSPGTNGLIIDLKNGKVPMLLPGGLPVVYSEDVARGHILAEKKAAAGARYILSESYHSLKSLAEQIAEELGLRKTPGVMPLWFARVFASVGEFIAGIINKPPLLPRGQLHFLQWRAEPIADRARAELGWQAVPLRDGLKRTIRFLRDAGRLPG